MKHVYLFLCCIFFAFSGNAQGWTELGSGANFINPNSKINAIATDSAGNVYAALNSSNYSSPYIAKWNGTLWSKIDTGSAAITFNGEIYCLTTDIAGNVYVGGYFSDATGHMYVAKWDGNHWSQLGVSSNALNANGVIWSLTTDNSGNVYAAGNFLNVSGYRYVSKWNGNTWSELGTGATSLNASGEINAIVSDMFGNIYAGGYFGDSTGAYLAKWNGSAWSKVGVGNSSLQNVIQISDIVVDTMHNVYVAGAINYSTTDTGFIGKWNGINWSKLGNNTDPIINNATVPASLCLDNTGNLYASGRRSNYNLYIGKWTGTAWAELPIGANASTIYDVDVFLKSDRHGNMYAGCTLRDTVGRYYVAKYIFSENNGGNTGGNDTSVTSSVHNITDILGLSIYPNPSSNSIYLQIKNAHPPLQISIMDNCGRLLQTINTSANELKVPKDIDLSKLISSLYLLHIAGKGINLTYKITKL